VVAVDAHVGTEPDQLVDEHEPALEDVLGDQGRAGGHRGERDGHRLQVGGEPGEGQRDDVDPAGPLVHRHPHAVGDHLDGGAGPDQLVQRDGEVLGHRPLDDDVAAGHHRPDRPGAGDDPVGARCCR
jgi:hypothetical protein